MKARWLQTMLLFGIPVMLLAACFLLQPFSRTLLKKEISVSALSGAQRTNLTIAARHLNGLILQPGERFSFNRAIGPRTTERGYQPAPSYLGEESPATIGGGLCLLSSAVYQLALEAGLQIHQRVPHLRTIHSVPAGLDATVWYGGADLRFTNTLAQPIRFAATLQNEHFSLSLQGTKEIRTLPVKRLTHRRNPQELLVTVFQQQRMVSRDLYRLSP